jgi:4-amino-4-deoxy-L-arabinose transferase-like glycosyltransferase
MVALNPLTLFFGRTGYSDMLLSACFGGALLAFFLGYAQPERRTVQERWYLAFYVLTSFGCVDQGACGSCSAWVDYRCLPTLCGQS